MSGVFKDRSTGAPLMILFENTNTRSRDYSQLKDVPRPGHADFTAHHKFGGYQDYRGGGHFSGRLTLGLVAAGVVAKKIIAPATVRKHIENIYGKLQVHNKMQAVQKAQKYNLI